MKYIPTTFYICFLLTLASCGSSTQPISEIKYGSLDVAISNVSFTSFASDSSSGSVFKDTLIGNRLVNIEIQRVKNDSSKSYQYLSSDSLFFSVTKFEVTGNANISQTTMSSASKLVLSNKNGLCYVTLEDSLNSYTTNEIGSSYYRNEKISLGFISTTKFSLLDSVEISFNKSNVISGSVKGKYYLLNYQEKINHTEYYYHRDSSITINELPDNFSVKIKLKK